MQTITDTMTNKTIPTEGLMIDEYLIKILNNYKEEFREYFYDKCREIIDYFVNCSTEMPIKSWFFYHGNVAKFPLSARGLFDNIKGLSKMNGLSFIKQFNLADKLKHSPRWVREIALRLKKLALLFSIKTNKVNYGFTFDLSKPVSEYFRTLVTLVFEDYSTSLNNANNANNSSKNTRSKASAQPPAQPSAGSRLEFSLAKLLYTKLCSRSHKIELLISRDKKKKEEKSKEGMHASVESQPAIALVLIFLMKKKNPLQHLHLILTSQRTSLQKITTRITTIITTRITATITPNQKNPRLAMMIKILLNLYIAMSYVRNIP